MNQYIIKKMICPVCGGPKIKEEGELCICLYCDAKWKKNEFQYESNDNVEKDYAVPKTSNNKESELTDVFAKVINDVCILTSLSSNKTKSVGTGFLIGANGFILTNAHVVTVQSFREGKSHVRFNNDIIAKFGNKNFVCEIFNLDINKDMAVLKLTGSSIKRSNLLLDENGEIKNGQRVATIGNSIGAGLAIAEGIVGDKSRKINGADKIMISIPVNHGNSGGPLFDMFGNIIGMVTSGEKNAVAMNYAIPSRNLCDFIRKTEKRECVKII